MEGVVGKARSLNCGRSLLLRFKWNRLPLFSILKVSAVADLETDLEDGVERILN